MTDTVKDLVAKLRSRAVALRVYGWALVREGDLVLLEEAANTIDRLRSLQAVPEGLTFAAFARANRERCESPQGFNHDLGSWTASDWVTAIVGELGEAANIVKKLNRYRDNIPGNKETADALRAKLRREIGDTFVYLDLLCQSLGFVVSEAAVEVFNAKSEEIGYPVVLSASPAPPVASGWQPMGTAPKDGTHFIGNTQWGAREIWWHKDTYEGEYWTDEGDSEPEPTGWIPLPGAAAPQTENDKEAAAAAYFRSAIADGQAAVLLADLATYDNVLRELGIQESHKHPVDEVRRIASLAETTEARGIERAAELIDRKVRDYTADHGSLDPETGTMEFSEAGEEYVSTLDELAEEIRALSAPAAPQTTSIKAPLPDWLGPDTPEQRAKLQAFVTGLSVASQEAQPKVGGNQPVSTNAAILADKILSSTNTRRSNRPIPDEKDKRIVGWVIDADDAGLSCALFALEEIERRAKLADALPSSSSAERARIALEALKAAERAHDIHANCEDCMESASDPVSCEHCFPSWNEAYELRQVALKQENGDNG